MSIHEHTLTGFCIPACMVLLGMVQASLSSGAAFIMYVRCNMNVLDN